MEAWDKCRGDSRNCQFRKMSRKRGKQEARKIGRHDYFMIG
jgi:hypothetical protein